MEVKHRLVGLLSYVTIYFLDHEHILDNKFSFYVCKTDAVKIECRCYTLTTFMNSLLNLTIMMNLVFVSVT